MNTSHPARRLSGDQMLWRISLSCLLSLALTSLTIGCDDDEPQSEPKAGESAGDPAGVMAGEVAGDTAGEGAGEVAGDMAGEVAGDTAGEGAGEGAGDTAGDTAGEGAGEVAGDMAGEVAGDMAGEVAGDMAGEVAGDMMMSSDYAPDTQLTALDEEGQVAFCEAFVSRDAEANASTSEADRQTFKEKSCLLSGLFGGATDTAGCEMAYNECIAEFEAAMVTLDSCLMEFSDAFNTCGATVAEFESCEAATRTLFLDAILNLPLTQTCDDVGDPALFIVAGLLPTEPPAECDTPALQMCLE